MTSPDGYTPDGSLSDTGLADFATKTQYSWQQDLHTSLANRFLPAQLGFLGIFNQVATAQKSANFANITNTITKASTLASGVSGGVAVNDPFSGSAATNFGASWSRTGDGSGSGLYGPNGSGSAVWTASGNSARRLIDRYTTPLSTGIQAVMTVMTTLPEAGSSLGTPYTYLLGRMNSSGDTFVYCRISRTDVSLGKCVSGTWSTPWASQSAVNEAGDQWSLLLGTNSSLSEILVIKNGYIQIQHTDTSGAATGNLYVGMAAAAVPSRSGRRYTNFTQAVPGRLDLWAAADRQSSIT